MERPNRNIWQLSNPDIERSPGKRNRHFEWVLYCLLLKPKMWHSVAQHPWETTEPTELLQTVKKEAIWWSPHSGGVKETLGDDQSPRLQTSQDLYTPAASLLSFPTARRDPGKVVDHFSCCQYVTSFYYLQICLGSQNDVLEFETPRSEKISDIYQWVNLVQLRRWTLTMATSNPDNGNGYWKMCLFTFCTSVPLIVIWLLGFGDRIQAWAGRRRSRPIWRRWIFSCPV